MPARGVEFSYIILEQILLLRKYDNKEDVLRVAQSMARVADATKDYSAEVKNAYKDAFNRLQNLEFEDMMEIIDIIS